MIPVCQKSLCPPMVLIPWRMPAPRRPVPGSLAVRSSLRMANFIA